MSSRASDIILATIGPRQQERVFMFHFAQNAFLTLGVAMFCQAVALAAEPEAKTATPERAVSVDTARDRAVLLHNVYTATLFVMHDRYFHEERAIVPARALEDVFEELSKTSRVKSRWISVNTKPMSLNHEPKTEFEKEAARILGEGKESFELIKDGYYHRAASIPLGEGCISCHTGFFANAPKTPRYAALVFRIKVRAD